MREFDADKPELMDRPQPVTEELRRDLRNLIGLNRWFGSHQLIRTWIKPWWKNKSKVQILDLCTGGGDIPRLLIAEAVKDKVEVDIKAIDYQASTVTIAREWSQDYSQINYETTNILELEVPLEPAHDLVLCSLALHHFSEEGAIRVLTYMKASARQGCMVADLQRGWWTSLGIWLLTAILYRDPMTVYDGRLSARRAFNAIEFQKIAICAGWKEFTYKSYFQYGRQVMWLNK